MLVSKLKNFSFKKVSCGCNFVVALTSNFLINKKVQGEVYSWGNNEIGALGCSTNNDQIILEP
jgi:hypothetical protein